MGMLGEFEYDSVFNGDYNPVTVAWMIYCAYLVINCIILMNLLVSIRLWFSLCYRSAIPTFILVDNVKTVTSRLVYR